MLIEIVIGTLFGVPILAGILVFVLSATWMQVQEEVTRHE